MTAFQDNLSPYISFAEHVDPSNPSAGNQRLFVDTDHILKMVDSSGTVTTFGTGGGGATKAFVGYNTVGGSGETMTQQRLYAKQITVGGSDVVLCSIECYIAITAEAVLTMGYALFEDSGSNTIGDMIEMVTNAKASQGFAAILAHGTGSYPARWYGMSFGRLLTASTKYWLGISYLDGSAAPSLKYDGSGSDRYYAAGTGPYIGDGAYTAFTQTDSTRKYSIRGLTIT